MSYFTLIQFYSWNYLFKIIFWNMNRLFYVTIYIKVNFSMYFNINSILDISVECTGWVCDGALLQLLGLWELSEWSKNIQEITQSLLFSDNSHNPKSCKRASLYTHPVCSFMVSELCKVSKWRGKSLLGLLFSGTCSFLIKFYFLLLRKSCVWEENYSFIRWDLVLVGSLWE